MHKDEVNLDGFLVVHQPLLVMFFTHCHPVTATNTAKQ